MGDIYTDNPHPNGIDSDNTLLFKIAAKLFGLGAGGTSGGGVPTTQSGSGLPYNADQYTVTSQVAAGPHVIVFKKSGSTVKTRTITYTNSGASASDTITDSTDS